MKIERCRYCGKLPRGISDEESGALFCQCVGMARFAYENGISPVPFKTMIIQWGPDRPLKSLEDATAVWNNIATYGILKS